MLSQRDYMKFKFSLKKILKECQRDSAEDTPDGAFTYVCNGTTSVTENNTYYYDHKSVLENTENLKKICKFLPKLNYVPIGTARKNLFRRFNY